MLLVTLLIVYQWLQLFLSYICEIQDFLVTWKLFLCRLSQLTKNSIHYIFIYSGVTVRCYYFFFITIRIIIAAGQCHRIIQEQFGVTLSTIHFLLIPDIIDCIIIWMYYIMTVFHTTLSHFFRSLLYHHTHPLIDGKFSQISTSEQSRIK